MSDATTKAVFLSYASQDAPAVERIAEALRAAGVEVWFDKNELVGGDAWDQKIRRQIKECALFVPVISANTNARAEGYFRLEWKLAVDRSHLMADDAPFLFPVVIDETSDAAARVPDRFREVQWTRLNVKDTPETLAKRVTKLLGGGGSVAGAPLDDARGRGRATPLQRKGPSWIKNAGMIGGILIGLVYAIRGAFEGPRGREPKPAAITPAVAPAPPTAPVSEARQLANRGFALSVDKYDSTLDDFTVAESLLKRAVALDPNDGEIWARSAQLNLMYRNRGFDYSPERIAAGREQAERAVRLVPDSAEAMFALSLAQRYTNNPAGSLDSLQRAIAIDPEHARALLFLGSILIGRGQIDEGLALYARARKQPEWAPLADYFEFLRQFNRRQFADADRLVRSSHAAKPSANNIAGIALIHLTWKGDLDEAARELAAVPAKLVTAPRVIWATVQVQLNRRKPDAALKALDHLPDDFIQDSWFTGPKASLVGRAQALAGREAAARIAWSAGLPVIDAKLKGAPDNAAFHLCRGQLLAWLGRTDEALQEARTVAEINRDRAPSWDASELTIYAILGLGDRAIPMLEAFLHGGGSWPLTVTILRQDPLWDKFRDDPRFQALCTESKEKADAKPLTESGPAVRPAQDSERVEGLAARALALIEKVGFTRDDLAPAEDFARRATEQAPDNAAAWGVRAGVQAAWLFRNWDLSEKRRQDTQTFANRALALDPDEPEAQLALGHLLTRQRAFEQAEALLSRASAAHPDHVRLARAHGFALTLDGREAESRAVLLATAQRAPRDPLLRYELAMTYGDYGHISEAPGSASAAIEQLDNAIAIQPFSSALLLKAVLLAGWRGDLAGMRGVLDQQGRMTMIDRSEDRAVAIAMWAGLLERRPDRVEAAAVLTARNYFDDAAMPLRPKAWSLALAHQAAGKAASARNDWQAAEAVLRQRLKDDPANARYQVELATTLAWLGQREEASRLVGLIEPLWKENRNIHQDRMLARFYGALGDAKLAALYLPSAIDRTPFTSRKVIPLDPWWDKIRAAPEFEALLKESVAKK